LVNNHKNQKLVYCKNPELKKYTQTQNLGFKKEGNFKFFVLKPKQVFLNIIFVWGFSENPSRTKKGKFE
jgi:hypothetical protein